MEKKLIQQLIQGDGEAFKKIYIRYKPIMYKFLMSFTNDTILSEDIIQEVFVNIWINREKINPDKSFSSYLLTCAKNKLFDSFRELSRNREMLERNWNNFEMSGNNTEEELEALELNELINSIIKSLSPRKKAIIELSRFQGKTHDEIAEELNISKNTVKNHMVESLKHIKSVLKNYGEVALIAVSLLICLSFICFSFIPFL